MTIQISYRVDTDPGQTDNVSLSSVMWQAPDNFGMGAVAASGLTINGLSDDQMIVAVQAILAALQTTIQATHPNAVVTLNTVSLSEQVQQVTNLYPVA